MMNWNVTTITNKCISKNRKTFKVSTRLFKMFAHGENINRSVDLNIPFDVEEQL